MSDIGLLTWFINENPSPVRVPPGQDGHKIAMLKNRFRPGGHRAVVVARVVAEGFKVGQENGKAA